MSEKQKDKRKNQGKRRWSKYPAWIFGVIVFSILLVVIIGHFWLIPAKVRWEVEKALLRFWDGQVAIEDIEVSYFGPVYLEKVGFFDKTGREYIHSSKVKIVFKKWPSLRPVVTKIEIEKLIFQLSTADGKFTLPFTNPFQQSTTLKKRVDIQKLTINDIEITVTDAKGEKTLYDGMQLFANKEGGLYDFTLSRIGSIPSESLLAKGKFDLKTLEIDFSLRAKHSVQRQEMDLIFAALNIPGISADGKLEADLTIIGCLKEPGGLEPNGIASFDGWTVVKDDKIITDNLATKADVKDKRFGFENITATVFGGNATGSVFVAIRQNQPTEFGGQVLTQNMSFVELTSVFGGPGKKATKGTVIFNYKFSGKDRDLQNLIGEGQVFLDDADISVIPVIPYIFKTIGLGQLEPLKMSDAECSFGTAGPVVTVKSARIANRLAAIRAEPGGTINLQTKQINIYVKAVMLKQIDAIVKQVPIINIIDNIKDKLTRLNIRGKWSDPPSKLIKKEPIKDIKEATVGFFQDVINSGGQITQKMRKKPGNFSRPENQQNTN